MMQKKGNNFLIEFNRTFYSEESLQDTIKQFKEFCEISLDCRQNSLLVSFRCDDVEIPLEFSNYALSLNKFSREKHA